MHERDVEYLRGFMGDYLRQRGLSLRRPFRCLSPDHEDRHPSMSYHEKTGRVRCFACGAVYDLFDLIGMDYGIENFPAQVERACALFGVKQAPKGKMVLVNGGKRERYLQKPDRSREDRDRQWLELERSGEDPVPWAEQRGITAESCEKYRLAVKDRRLWFPIMEQGRCAGWCGRALEAGMEPRYRNSPGPLGLWNGDLLLEEGGGRSVFVTEGVVDAICLEQMGRRAVSLCGCRNTAKLVQHCKDHSRTANTWRFVLCGDGDDAGRDMNRRLGEQLDRLGLPWAALELPYGDVADWCRRDPDWLRKRLRELEGGREEGAESPSAAESLDWFFRERETRRGRKPVSSGLPALDRALDGGFYPGLYVLGAISSLGKTSLALQMADYIAANGMDVLYISLEQSRGELIAKSLSRVSALVGERMGQEGFTVRQLLNGQEALSPGRVALLQETRRVYGDQAGGLFLEEGLADIGTREIREQVRRHSVKRGAPPFVVVDYLQILCPSDPRASDKQNVDRAVVELKRTSRDFDIPILAVSSFNRENYRCAVSMEAFKESGAVEYSADVLLGLQLENAGSKDFDVNREKIRDPRPLELVMLKNRNGAPYAVVPLAYTAKYGLFRAGKRAAGRIGSVV